MEIKEIEPKETTWKLTINESEKDQLHQDLANLASDVTREKMQSKYPALWKLWDFM